MTFLDHIVEVTLRDGRTLTTYRAGTPHADDLIVLESGASMAAPYWGRRMTMHCSARRGRRGIFPKVE
jgi:hypothetical protein